MDRKAVEQIARIEHVPPFFILNADDCLWREADLRKLSASVKSQIAEESTPPRCLQVIRSKPRGAGPTVHPRDGRVNPPALYPKCRWIPSE
jgi:hypothetical protein